MWRRHRKKEPYDVRGTRNHSSPFPDTRNTRGIRDSERGTRLTTAQRNEENRNRTQWTRKRCDTKETEQRIQRKYRLWWRWRPRQWAITNKCERCGKYQDAIDTILEAERERPTYKKIMTLSSRRIEKTNTETTLCACGPSLTWSIYIAYTYIHVFAYITYNRISTVALFSDDWLLSFLLLLDEKIYFSLGRV